MLFNKQAPTGASNQKPGRVELNVYGERSPVLSSLEIPCWRVLKWNPTSMMWVLHKEHDEEDDAKEYAEALQHADPRARVRVSTATRRVVIVRQQILSRAREYRLEQAGRMIELADAKKRYKSPG